MVEPIKKESSVTLGEMYELITKSKSQIRRINTQTGLTEVYWADPNEPADVDLLVQELAMANGHIEYLRGELQELQTEVERLQAELEKERRLHGMARSTISSRTAEVERLRAEVHWLEKVEMKVLQKEIDRQRTVIKTLETSDWFAERARANSLQFEIERLQSELVGIKLLNDLQAEAIESKVFGEIKLGEPNPPYPKVPKSERRQLTRNAAFCHTCYTTIESRSRHDWKACNCPEKSDTGIYVDGGLAYSRRGAGVNASYDDLCEYE